MSIIIQELTKTYPEHSGQKAVDNISFEARAGEILGFLGPNGAGKTTTMKMITCFMPPAQGKITVNGYDTRENSLDVRRQIGYLPEHNPLYPDMYVHEYLRFVGKINKIPSASLKSRIEEIIHVCGLTSEQHKKISELSKGYRQRTGLAQALMHSPSVLILDEPTSGLDPNQIVEIRNLIKKTGKEKTVIFSTHILSEVQAICDRVIIIHKGKIVADDTPERLTQKASGETVIHLEVIPSNGTVRKEIFSVIKGVKKVDAPAQSSGGNANEILIYTEPNTDARKEIFDACVKNNYTILTLNRETQTLENIFRMLTTTEEKNVN